MKPKRSTGLFAIIGPGLLVAATGVGAGDLATASLAGSYLGTAILWAAVVGAFLKYVVTEGLARWQLATGDTLLEGVVRHFGPVAGWLFLPYFMFWSFFVASALMNACGVTLHAIVPVFDDARTGKIVFGALASLIGLALALKGGYALFDKVMRVCIGVMFVTVVVSAAFVWPGTGEVGSGLLVPRIPDLDGEGLGWTVALIGGVGGTFTVLCYGYWIREEGREGTEALRTCRIDLGAGYLMTALFGIAMVIIGSTIEIEGGGATLLVDLSARLAERIGPVGSWLFLVGAAGAVFSSLLGCWQAVPYLFADVFSLVRHRGGTGGEPDQRPGVDTASNAYRGYMIALAFVPMVGLFSSFARVQQVYAIVGATFIPLLALVLLILNGRGALVGEENRNGPATTGVLVAILILFAWITWTTIA
ncbi:MAG TPA: Nramp family divalent metal transporter [Gammaproteobacteria bacterium]|nr:Nramp family divalent metal transporter [Gammaproteobacteria bacterium]